jgi:Ca-activated chloride channel family protein
MMARMIRSSGKPIRPILALLGLLIVPLFAGAAAAPQFTSGVNLVEVYATVTDADGAPVSGLKAADFRVSQDGALQTISAFAEGDFPLSVAIALDRSFSMSGVRLALAKRAAAAFIAALRDQDEVMVLAIGSEIETITPPVSARQAASVAWSKIDPWGTTPLFDVTRRAIDEIQARRGRRALLIISDGADRGSDITAADLIDYARRTDVLIYPVAISKTRPAVFAELASVTGGRSIWVQDAKQLDTSLTVLAHELRRQYLLGYVPSDSIDRNAAWHSIEVTVDRPNVKIRARDGYFGR